MKTVFPRLARFISSAFALSFAGLTLLHAAEAPPAPDFVAASDAHFRYEGRFDMTDRAAPVVIWQGSRIALDFDGEAVTLRFDDVKDQVFFDVTIDGRTSVAALRAGRPPEGVQFVGLGAGRHQLRLFKRSEATAGTVRFRGVALAAGAHTYAPEPPDYRLKMLFIGDSITVGACNEDGQSDQWEDRRTHDNARSYGAFTAAAFLADYRNIAVSGMGIVTGYVPFTAGEIWNRVYPDPKSPLADFTEWAPAVVFVNFGENDDSFTRVHHQPFPSAAFTQGYVALVHSIRSAYPAATIVILRGGMFGGAQSERLRGPWQAAVAELEKTDPHVTHYVFKHWSNTHPRVVDDRAMADELVAWLKRQPFMPAESKKP